MCDHPSLLSSRTSGQKAARYGIHLSSNRKKSGASAGAPCASTAGLLTCLSFSYTRGKWIPDKLASWLAFRDDNNESLTGVAS